MVLVCIEMQNEIFLWNFVLTILSYMCAQEERSYKIAWFLIQAFLFLFCFIFLVSPSPLNAPPEVLTKVHHKLPHAVTMPRQDSDNVVTISLFEVWREQ